MLEKIREILAEQLNCSPEDINEDTSFKDDLGADSLDLLEVVMALEDEYDKKFNVEDLNELTTVGEVIEYLNQHGLEI